MVKHRPLEAMTMFARRVRGLLGIAVVWGLAISAIGTAFILTAIAARWLHAPDTGWVPWIRLAVRVAVRDFVVGGASGALFAMVLAGAERRRDVESLSYVRVGTWGFLAAAVPAAIVGALSFMVIPPATFVVGTIATGFVGTALSVAMLRLARRAKVPAPRDQTVTA